MDHLGNQRANKQAQAEAPLPRAPLPRIRRPGKPPGYGKPPGSGRKPGTPNKSTREIREIAQLHGKKAINKLVLLMKSENEATSLRAAVELLDRAYGRPVTPSEVSGPGGGPIRMQDVTPEEVHQRVAAMLLAWHESNGDEQPN